MGMARARSCEGVPRIARGDLEDGTHGQPDPGSYATGGASGDSPKTLKKLYALMERIYWIMSFLRSMAPS